MRQHEKRGEMDKRLCYSGLGKHALFCVIRRHGRARGKYGRVHVKKTTNILTSSEGLSPPSPKGIFNRRAVAEISPGMSDSIFRGNDGISVVAARQSATRDKAVNGWVRTMNAIVGWTYCRNPYGVK